MSYIQKFNPNAIYLDIPAFEKTKIITCDPYIINQYDPDDILNGTKPNNLNLLVTDTINDTMFRISLIDQYSNADGSENTNAQNAPYPPALLVTGFGKFHFFTTENMPTPQNLYNLLAPDIVAHGVDKMIFADCMAHSFIGDNNLYLYMSIFMGKNIFIRHFLSPI